LIFKFFVNCGYVTTLENYRWTYITPASWVIAPASQVPLPVLHAGKVPIGTNDDDYFSRHSYPKSGLDGQHHARPSCFQDRMESPSNPDPSVRIQLHRPHQRGIRCSHDENRLGITASQFGWGAGILFAGYCIFEFPSNLALYKFGERKWFARIMVTWGLAAAATATALATSPNSFYIARFILGVAEAGFLPGVTFFLACWFPAKYRARMIAWFVVPVPFSSISSGPLSGALFKLDGIFGLAGWKWMFILEGLSASFLGLAVYFILRDSPIHASWLMAEERHVLTETLLHEQREKRSRGFNGAMRDPRPFLPF
jgi:MFS family permease